MSDQDVTPVPNPDSEEDEEPSPVAKKVTFDVPKVNGQGAQAKFVSFIFDADLSKGFIEEGLRPASEGGAGKPLYSVYAFPYVPPEQPEAGGGAESSGEKMTEPLYVAYVYPFELPNNIELAGDGPGAHGALGGTPGPTTFYGRIKPLLEEEQEKKPEATKESA